MKKNRKITASRSLHIGEKQPVLQISLSVEPDSETLIDICESAHAFDDLLGIQADLTVAREGRKLFFRFEPPETRMVFPLPGNAEQEAALRSLSTGIGVTLKSMRLNRNREFRFPKVFLTLPAFLSSLGYREKQRAVAEAGHATLSEAFFKTPRQ